MTGEALRGSRYLARLPGPMPKHWWDWSGLVCSVQGCCDVPVVLAPVRLADADPELVYKAWLCDLHDQSRHELLFGLSGQVDKIVAVSL